MQNDAVSEPAEPHVAATDEATPAGGTAAAVDSADALAVDALDADAETPSNGIRIAHVVEGAVADSDGDEDADTPAVVVDLQPEAVPAATRLQWLARVIAVRAQRITPWQVAFAGIVTLYVAYFTQVTLEVHHGLGTSSYDVGLYEQGVYLLSHGKAPFVTLMGRNMFGDHASFILLAVAPIYRLFPTAGTLFFFQSLVIGLGSLPVFLAARRRLQSEAMALALAVCFLLHPAVGWTNRENFHPDCVLALFVGMAIYGALERKWRLYWVFIILTILVKEDVSLVLVPLGVWVAMRRDLRYGVATACATVGATLVGMYAVMRSLIGVPTRNGWRIPFGGPSGLLEEVLERPGNVIEHFRSDNRPFYLWQMTFPMAFAFLRRPGIAAISLVVISTNMLSTFWYQYHLEYHYSLIAVPAIVLGAVYALEVVGRRWRRRATALIVATSVWACMMWGVVPLGKLIEPGAKDPLGRTQPYYWPPSHPVAVAAREIFPDVPDGASVSAYHALTPHLANRELIYQFPNPFRVVLYGPNTDLEYARSCLTTANDLQYVMLQKTVPADLLADWDRIEPDFTAVAQNQYWVLYHRTGHSVQCVTEPGAPFPHLVVNGG